MSWFNVWDGIKNKTCRYLMQRYLGQFLEEKINLEQLKVDLYNGKATIRNVSLNVDALNDIFEAQGWAVELIEGHIGELTVKVPWNALMTSNSQIEVSNLMISVRPIKRQDDGTSMLESMWSSASSTMQLAEECMKQKDDGCDDFVENNTNAINGLEKFAETIDRVLNRIKVNFVNTVVRLDHTLSNSKIAIVLNIQNVMYKNETGYNDIPRNSEMTNIQSYESFPVNNEKPFCNNINNLPNFAKHNILLDGIFLYTEELSMKTNDVNNKNLNCKDKLHFKQDSFKIPILHIKGLQKIQIKMKQSEHLKGAKVYLDVGLDSIYAFIAPRQIHLIIKMFEAFYENDVPNLKSSYIKQKTNTVNDDYESFNNQQILIQGNLCQQDSWSKDSHELFPTKSESLKPHIKKNSTFSNSSLSSSTFLLTNNGTPHRNKINEDNCGEILNFNIRVISFVGVSLYNDILDENVNNEENIKSQRKSIKISEAFFEKVSNNELKGNFCDNNHILVRILPIFIEGIQQRRKNILLLKLNLSATKLDLFEVLNRKPKPLIYFHKSEDSDSTPNRPEISIAFKSSHTCNLKDGATISYDVKLEKCTIELDISLYDRLSTILGKSQFEDSTHQYTTGCRIDVKSATSLIHINAASRTLSLKLRFPVIKTTPCDNGSISWEQQNIRPDFLLVTCNQFVWEYHPTHMDFISSKIDVFYCENDIKSKVHIMKTSMLTNENETKKEEIFNCPRLSLKWVKGQEDIFTSKDAEYARKAYEDCNPFSLKRECRQSNSSDKTESESLFLPGDRKEIQKFCETTVKHSKRVLKINLPEVEVCLESKCLYEVLYNRFNFDLLMWEPTSPLYKSTSKNCYSNSGSTKIPTSKIESDKLNASTDIWKNELKFCDNVNRKNSISEKITDGNGDVTTKIPLCGISVDIFIQKGSLSLFTPVRNDQAHILPQKSGKIEFRFENLTIFGVTEYKSNPNKTYVCIQLADIEVYHCGVLPSNSYRGFQEQKMSPATYMQSVFYKIPNGLTKDTNKNNEDREMLTFVLKAKKLSDKKIKRIKMTMGVQEAAVRHRSTFPPHIWLNQLIDFFDVTDFPIEGYQPAGIITEVQLHFWNCAVDYRPIGLSYRALLEVGYFLFCSNIISSSAGCNLRFVAEECVLSISPFDCLNVFPDNQITFLPSKNIVPVLDFGLIDISLRLFEQNSKKHPKLDLRSSLYNIHIRTCYDSAYALAQLITYIANEGTNITDLENNTNMSNETVKNYSDTPESGNCKVTYENFKKQQQRVNLMMAEAIEDFASTPISNSNRLFSDKSGIEEFFFPDENTTSTYKILKTLKKKQKSIDQLPQVESDLGVIKRSTSKLKGSEKSLTDDDFCIISDDHLFLHNHGKEEVTVLEDPLMIVDNHFCLPSEKKDLLQSPENFPMAMWRYTLCEMSFTWHLYGGNDFSNLVRKMEKSNEKCETQKMSEVYKQGVSFVKGACSISYGKKTKEKLTWKSVGGPARNHNLLVEIEFSKVRFSHDIYPSSTLHASRQVLLINNVEVRDRLQTSDINKFLYQSNIRNAFNKNHNMVVIKAVYDRPTLQHNSSECSLRISLMPLRLHIDQNTLLFLADFFTNIGSDYSTESTLYESRSNSSTVQLVQSNAPVMSVNDLSDIAPDKKLQNLFEANLEILMQNEGSETPDKHIKSEKKSLSSIYFREIIFSPEVSICFDYHGHRVEMSRGPITGLLMGLGQLQCSKICLKEIVYRRGILGLDKVITHICKEWIKDIKKNQLPEILKGVAPTYAFLQIFQGVHDLFWMPIEQYHKDGRVMRGFQLGAQSFSARTALAALEITSRFIQILQFTAETAFDMVSPGPSIRRSRMLNKGKKRRVYRAKDFREGLSNAYLILKDGFNESATNIIEIASTEHDQKGYSGAVGAVMRQLPQLVVCPAVLATQATTNILGGVKSSLLPEAKEEAREKWKEDCE